MAQGAGGGVASVVPTLERGDRARSSKGWFAEASYGVPDRKAIGETP